MLSAVLQRDGQQHPATQTRDEALTDAEQLALLHAIWTAETTPAREQRHRDLLTNALPSGHRAEPGYRAAANGQGTGQWCSRARRDGSG